MTPTHVILARSLILAIIAMTIAGLWNSPALPMWKEEYAQLPESVREWYRTRTLTPAAYARFQFHSCCAQADVVETKFRVNTVSNDDVWEYVDTATNKWKVVPSDIIHWGESAPDGQPTMFVVAGIGPVCFFPGSSLQ